MLNISKNKLPASVSMDDYSSYQMLSQRNVSKGLIRLLAIISVVAIIAMFLPWTQNIRSDGFVTTMTPSDRPQPGQSLIDGKIQKWYVREGNLVSVGDTILTITEAKEAYLDPEIIANTRNQRDAKQSSVEAYTQKVKNLEDQYAASLENMNNKLEQNSIKINKVLIAIESDSNSMIAKQLKLANANNQWKRSKELYDRGLTSLTSLEKRDFARQEAEAELIAIRNKIQEKRQELDNLRTNAKTIRSTFGDKLAKIQSDKASAQSMRYEAEGEVNKLNSSLNQYSVRQENYVLRADIEGYITKIKKPGIGAFVKAQEDIYTIVPKNTNLAVELYVRPRDMPLMRIGNDVRIQFDGWPAIVFSGWPDNSYGTFAGRIFAVENDISSNGLYRILVAQDPDEQPWPPDVRVGGGARAIMLLNQVPLYYEVWRQLNGFPPDYYDEQEKYKAKETKAPKRRLK